MVPTWDDLRACVFVAVVRTGNLSFSSNVFPCLASLLSDSFLTLLLLLVWASKVQIGCSSVSTLGPVEVVSEGFPERLFCVVFLLTPEERKTKKERIKV